MQERIIELETRLAYQENMIDELNGVVFEQQKQIDRLTDAVEFLAKRMQDISEKSGEGTVIDERPPHY